MTNQEQLLTYGQAVIDALQPLVKWQFNEHHQVMLAEFSVDKQQQVMQALAAVLPFQWDAKSIKKASGEISHMAGFFAKLIKNQQLFSAEPSTRPKVMVAWWPWGHGATVSVRLFLTDQSDYQPKSNLLQRLATIFA